MPLKTVSLGVMAVAYVLAGLNHFRAPGFYRPMMPPYLPAHDALIALSGVAEVLLGVGLMVPSTRVGAAWGVIALLVAVFPANLYMFQTGGAGYDVPRWALGLRLPLQAVLIAWAWWHTRP